MHGFCIIVVFGILIILAYSSPVTDQDTSSEPPTVLESLEELKASNTELQEKVDYLEKEMVLVSSALQYVREDLNYFHPTVQYEFVDINIVNWTAALRDEMRQQSYAFHMGQELGAFSTWVVFLSYEKATNSLGVHLNLQDQKYHANFLFAGFSVSFLDSDGNTFSNLTLLPTNFLEMEDNTVHLSNAISVSTIQNPLNKLIQNDTLRLRVRVELLGSGHKLYQQSQMGRIQSRDLQTVVFQVKDVLDKTNTVDGDTSSIAHTTFELHHPWGATSSWNTEIKMEQDKTIALIMEMTNVNVDWSQLYASFKVEIYDSRRKLIKRHEAPYHDYKKQLLLFENIISIDKIQEISATLRNDTLEFKLYFVVFNKNARFYYDIF